VARRLLRLFRILAVCAFAMASFAFGVPGTAHAQSTEDNPQSGSVGIEGEIPSKPPATAPTINTPRTGQSFNTIPIDVNGLCTSGLIVKIFSNNVFVGSAECKNGSYTLKVDLFSGQNDLVARSYDSLDQPSPDSNIVTVTFNDSQYNPFGGALLSLTSNYARRGADPGKKLSWPVILSGGTSPYAISVDWGDGKSPDLISTAFTGTVDLSHVYNSAGVYRVIVKATDKNGLSAYLQLVAVANGATQSNSKSAPEKTIIQKVLWLPALICIPLIMLSFWLGQRYELATLRKHLEQQRDPDED